MAISSADKQAMEAGLKKLGLPYEQIKVFGAIRCNVHVLCASRDAAGKWAAAFSQVFKGAKVSCVSTKWEAKQNHGTCLLPTMRAGFLVAVAA